MTQLKNGGTQSNLIEIEIEILFETFLILLTFLLTKGKDLLSRISQIYWNRVFTRSFTITTILKFTQTKDIKV